MRKKLQNPPTPKLTAGEYVAKLTEMGAAQARELLLVSPVDTPAHAKVWPR
jgi:hypothetical protein